MKIAILDDYHHVAETLADWSALGPSVSVHSFTEYLPEGPERVAALAPFDVIIAMRERTAFPRTLIDELPALRLLVTTGLRNNSIDMQACRDRGVTVCGAPGSARDANATAELAWAHILGLFKNLPYEDASMRKGNWQTAMPLTLAGKRLGVAGLGKLGTAVAKVGQAFGMDVVAWSPNLDDERAAKAGVKRVDKQTLFSTSDVVSMHLVLSDRTRNVVDAATLASMQPTAFLVNTSRAGLVDQAALIAALRDKRLGGAGLDVYPAEPLAADDSLRKLPNVTITPHLGYVSMDNFEAFYKSAVAAVKAWVAKAPVNVLN